MSRNYSYSSNDGDPIYGVNDMDIFLKVNCCGYDCFDTDSFTQTRLRGRVDYYLIYVVQGQIEFFVNNSSDIIKHGEYIIIFPNTSHCIKYDCSFQPKVYWIHFTGYGVEKLLKQSGVAASACIKINSHIINLFESIIYELQLKKECFEEFSTGCLIKILALIGRYQKHNLLNQVDEDIEKAVIYIHNNYKEISSINHVADMCSLSMHHFIRKFKKIIGKSPMQYIIDLKINHAKNLLFTTSLPLNRISSILGYSDSLYFSRLFKKHVGVSPSTYRKRDTNI